jgi:protoheme IX farnesyltransferase
MNAAPRNPAVRSASAVGTSGIADLVSLTKPRITLMVLITTAGGLWLAPDAMTPIAIFATLLGTALVVSSANALNCWMERDVDRHMARTKQRPLPAGRMAPRIALRFGLVLGAFAVPLLALMVNPLTGLLAAIALVSYVWIYTPMKQVSPAALLIGSIPGAMPPLMGWTAATGSLDAPGIVLFGILFLWQLPHFLAIALFRQNEYTKAGIKVMPAVRGIARTRLHAAIYAGALVPTSLLLVPLGIAGIPYLVIAGIAGIVFAGLCIAGLRLGEHHAGGNRWARAVFLASLAYLPLLFAALAVDVAAG